MTNDINWGQVLLYYPTPDGFDSWYIDKCKEDMRENVQNGGNPKDKVAEKIFLRLCRLVDIYCKQDIDWKKTALDYWNEVDSNLKGNGD